MKQKLYYLFPPLTIYNPAWTDRLPVGRQQVWSLYGLVALLALAGGLAGATLGTYLPLRWICIPVGFLLMASGLYRLYNLVLTDFQHALTHKDWLYGTVLVLLILILSLGIAHVFALVVFQDVIRLAELRAAPAGFLDGSFFVDSWLLFENLSQPIILILWGWLQVVTVLLFTMPFIQLFFTRHNLHTHLYHVRQTSSSVPQLPQPESKGKYSALQYLMWLVAGSEISFLKKCPADYNRHATIGYTLLITCVFAAIAGGYAGYFFSKSIVASLVVALVWGLLVYSIDRSMVVSLKKDPESTGYKQYIPQLLVRAALGFLIAFFISIPIELLIFDESISAQIQIDKVSELNTFGKSASGAFNVKKQQDEEKRQRENEKRIQEALNNPPPTEEYRSLKQALSECRAGEQVISQQLGRVRGQRDQFLRNVPSITKYNRDGMPYNAGPNKQSSQWQNYIAKRNEGLTIQRELTAQQVRCSSANESLKSYEEEWRRKKATNLLKHKTKRRRLVGVETRQSAKQTLPVPSTRKQFKIKTASFVGL